jgi:FkbM family methyltransferase
VPFWDGFAEDFNANFDKYEGVYHSLYDKTSKNQFYNIINFRLSYDLNYMRGFSAIEDKQYFEDFLTLRRGGETFIDIGAFDGYTSREFIRLCPDYRAVYLFEPDGNNIDSAKKRLARFNNIFFHQKGLSDKKQVLRFDSSGASSRISETGSIRIEVDRLDDVVAEPVSFIKMDIEGAEADAIAGAVNIIERHHPKLAISVYHKPDDLWKIPEQILAIRNDYQLYLRHYTEGFAETVMFFVPRI